MEWLDQGWLTVGVIVGLALLFNIGLLYAVLSGSTKTHLKIMERILERARNPWQREDEDLRELNARTRRLQAEPEKSGDDSG